jgi:hypothetical protein
MDVNRVIDDSIDNPEPLEPSPPRSKVLYHKFFTKSKENLDHLPQVRDGFGSSTTSRRRIWIVYYKSEEDLDRLLQVGGRLASIHRRAPISADYSDFINDTLPLSNGHRSMMAPPSLIRRARALEGHESSKLPGSAHLSVFSTRSGGLGHWMGTESSKLPDPSPLFRTTNPCQA